MLFGPQINANKYDAELQRTDKLHNARLQQCEDSFWTVIVDAAEAKKPPVFTDWDLPMIDLKNKEQQKRG